MVPVSLAQLVGILHNLYGAGVLTPNTPLLHIV